MDLTANQFMEAEDTETYQLGYHHGDKSMVTFRSRDSKYWQVEGKGVKVNSPSPTPPSCHFKLQWHDNKVSITTSDDKFLRITSGGTVQPSAGINGIYTELFCDNSLSVDRCQELYLNIERVVWYVCLPVLAPLGGQI